MKWNDRSPLFFDTQGKTIIRHYQSYTERFFLDYPNLPVSSFQSERAKEGI